jgi:hypothetical protein
MDTKGKYSIDDNSLGSLVVFLSPYHNWLSNEQWEGVENLLFLKFLNTRTIISHPSTSIE